MRNNFKLKNSTFNIQHSALFLRGFTMVELIFVIVVIGILAYVGSSYIPDNSLPNDTKFLIMKIKQRQKNAIGHSTISFGENPWGKESSSTCIDLNITALEQEDLSAQKPYKFASKITPKGVVVCFDSYGRPYRNNSEHLLLRSIDINLTKGQRVRRLKLYSFSGYISIVVP